MGFLLVFFPEEKIKLSSSPSSSSLLSFIKSSTKKNPSHLLSKAQSIISICALLVFITLLLFTLSTFEPSSSSSTTSTSNSSSRRQLSETPSKSHKNGGFDFPRYSVFKPYALQKMGTLYRRGTNAMNNLIVAHIVESLNLNDLKLFLRVLHRSNLISRSDLLFIFPSKSLLSNLHSSTILEEHTSFLKLIQHYEQSNSNSTLKTDPTRILKWGKVEKGSGESIWGRRIRSNSSSEQGSNNSNSSSGSTRLSYGSIVGFDVDELDPESSLSGFLDHVPMSLRRWACYPMLLGRVKRNFKHVMLVDIKEMLILNDPSHRVKNPGPDSVHLFSAALTKLHSKKNSERTRSTRSKSVSPAMIYGGEKGVRRLSNAMLTEIVRRSVQQNKKKNSAVTESGVFNQLVSNEFLLTNVNLVMQSELIPELSSLSESSLKQGSEFAVVRKGNNNGNNSEGGFTVVKNLLCSSVLDSLFYSDC